MKKILISVLVCMMLMVAGCASKEQVDGICPYMIMVEDMQYYCYDEIIEVKDVEVLGYITSHVEIKYPPKENNQSNFPDCLEQPYGMSEGQMLIYYSDNWHICYPVEEDK